MRLEKVETGLHPLQSQPYNKQSTSTTNEAIETRVNQQKIELRDNENIGKEGIEIVISKLNEFIDPLRTNLKFEYHEKLNDYYVTVVNPITDEVIREIPSRKMLDMYAAMVEVMGLFVDETI